MSLESDIVHFRRRPGDILDERSLAAEFGVSRTPVREALRQLAANGLVQVTPHCGTVVANISAAELDDMFAVMAEIEALCASWAARRMTPDERRGLESAHMTSARAVAAGAMDDYERANWTFHEIVYGGSHNPFLTDLARSFRQRLSPFRKAQFETLGRLAHSLEEHERVVQAIMRGDSGGAAEMMRSHILLVRQAVDHVEREPAVRSVDGAAGIDGTAMTSTVYQTSSTARRSSAKR